DAASLDLLWFLASRASRVPILFLLAQRMDPGAPEPRPSRTNFTQLVLEPLTDEEAARIVEATFDWLPDELRDRIVARAGGNPFFIEESLRSLVESGAVQKDDGGEWREGRYRFKHAVVQEVAYNTLLVRRRALLHRGVAVAYEKVLNENELREFYPALAHHYLLGDVPDKAVEYSWKAAQRATAIR